MEGVQARVQEAVSGLVDTLDKEYFRKMQANMYHCSAACCENQHYNMNDSQRCIEKCGVPLQQAQNYLQTELSNYQDRLQRCAMDCQDKVKDKITPTSTEADVARYRGDFEQCVIKCGETHVALVPQILKKMREVLKQGQK